MSWADAATLALRSLRRRAGRSVLTVLAVALAASLLTALLTIAGTAQNRVLSELAKGGPLAGIKVAAAEPDPAQIDNDDAKPGPPKDIDQAALDRIRTLPDVKSVVPIVAARILVIPPTTLDHRVEAFPTTALGIDLEQSSNLPITVVAGRLPLPGALAEVAVTQGFLERLKIPSKSAASMVGASFEMAAPRVYRTGRGRQQVRGRWVTVEIVGVIAQEAGSGQVLTDRASVDQARAWTAAGEPSDDPNLAVATSAYSGLFVISRSLDRVGPLRNQITAIGYSTAAPENLLASVQRYLHVVEIVLSGIGLIALVIAAIGITNALLAAIRERRREIGVLKAIGARDRDVRRVFLIEATIIGFLGGLVGTAAGFAIAAFVGSVVNGYLASEGLAGVALSVPLVVALGGIFGSTVLALAAGVVPAWRAARLPAIEAVSV